MNSPLSTKPHYETGFRIATLCSLITEQPPKGSAKPVKCWSLSDFQQPCQSQPPPDTTMRSMGTLRSVKEGDSTFHSPGTAELVGFMILETYIPRPKDNVARHPGNIRSVFLITMNSLW